jgi:N-acetylneuraminate synthase
VKINELFAKPDFDDVYIVAEISQNHDGSLGQAHAFIDACATTGVDAIKFQTHIAEAESTPDEPFRVKFSYEDKTRYDYWKRMEFSETQWIGLKEHAQKCGLDFLSSPFSKEAFILLDRIGVPAWKLGSGEVFNSYLLDLMIKTKKPILLSSGMSTYDDLKNQVYGIEQANGKFAIFQCTTTYPTSYSEIGLNIIGELKNRFKCPVGLSDHSGTIFPSLAAVALGVKLIEVHVTMSKYMFGPDISSSLTIEQLKEMVEGVRAISCMLNNPCDKNILDEEHGNLKKIFAKGIYINKDIEVNSVLSEEDLCMKKPLQGITAERYKEILGKRIRKDLKKGQYITWDDII